MIIHQIVNLFIQSRSSVYIFFIALSVLNYYRHSDSDSDSEPTCYWPYDTGLIQDPHVLYILLSLGQINILIFVIEKPQKKNVFICNLGQLTHTIYYYIHFCGKWCFRMVFGTFPVLGKSDWDDAFSIVFLFFSW